MKNNNFYPILEAVKAFLGEDPIGLLINGEPRPARSKKSFAVRDPSTGSVIGHVAEGDAPDIDDAVTAARAAFPAWRETSPAERTTILWKLSELIERDADELAQLDMLDTGLTFNKARHGEIPAVIEDLRYYAGWTTKLGGKTVPVSIPGYTVYTVREPIGVCGAITQWNYPMEAFSGKVGPALACGNTLVLKPSEDSPLSALWLGKLCLEAGIPPGVVNVVPGFGGTAGAALTSHDAVHKIGFTGSVDVARKIIHASAGNIKRLSLELGGKSPNVIFADADRRLAVENAVSSIFERSGQNCVAGSRLFIEHSVYESVLNEIIENSKRIKVGHAFDTETEVGPLISKKQLQRVQGYIRSAIEAGAKLQLGGGRPENAPENGYFLEPTVFTDVHDEMSVVREEIFGPVLCVSSFQTFEELITRANSTSYGLAASIWTRDLSKAHRFAREIQAGIVWVNGQTLFDSAAPFGGVKHSGYGRDLGEASIDEYSQLKTVWIGFDA